MNAASVNSTELIHTCYYTLGKNGKFVVANKSGEAFAEKEVRVRLVLGEWLYSRNRLGTGLVRSALAHSKTELRERRGQAIQELELYGLRSRNG